MPKGELLREMEGEHEKNYIERETEIDRGIEKEK